MIVASKPTAETVVYRHTFEDAMNILARSDCDLGDAKACKQFLLDWGVRHIQPRKVDNGYRGYQGFDFLDLRVEAHNLRTLIRLKPQPVGLHALEGE